MEQWGVDPKTVRLLRNMRAASWFSYGGVDEAVSTRVGGRQGCKFGACIFNSTFSVALIMVHDTLARAGVAMQLPSDAACPWTLAAPPADAPAVDVLEKAFVDDTALMLVARTPELLDCAINVLLTTVQSFYRALNLETNWGEGKTEAFLVYRGQGAACRMRAWRPTPGAKPSISVPNSDSILNIVSSYRHLGGEIAVSGSLVPLAMSRRRRALAAYAPLAMKVFGSANISLDLNLCMFQTQSCRAGRSTCTSWYRPSVSSPP